MTLCNLSRRHGDQAPQACSQIIEAERGKVAPGVDQDDAIISKSAEDVDLVEQRRIADDHSIRMGNRLVGADRLFGDAAEGNDRGPGALRPEGGEGLRVPSFVECGYREQLGRCYDPLASSAVNTNREHSTTLNPRTLLHIGLDY